MKAVNVLLFEGFTTMDALGPAEALSRAREGKRKCYEIEYFSVAGGLAGSSTGAKIWTRKLDEMTKFDFLLVSGDLTVCLKIPASRSPSLQNQKFRAKFLPNPQT